MLALSHATCIRVFEPQFPHLCSGEIPPIPWGAGTFITLFFLHCPLPLCLRTEFVLAPISPGAVTISTPSLSSVHCDQEPLDPIYLPAALELLDAPEHFRVQQVGRYPPANSSLGSRSETFLLLQPWPRAQPLLRASYPPFATQQVRRGSQDSGRPRSAVCGSGACPSPCRREPEAHKGFSCRLELEARHPSSQSSLPRTPCFVEHRIFPPGCPSSGH